MHNSAAQYGSVARFLHWAIAILIIVTLPCAWVMTNSGPGPLQNFLFVTHESIGLTVLALAVLRVIWRLVEPPPPHDVLAVEVAEMGHRAAEGGEAQAGGDREDLESGGEAAGRHRSVPRVYRLDPAAGTGHP